MANGTKTAIKPVDSKTGLENIISQASEAQKAYATFSQSRVDAIFRTAAMAASNARISLA